MSSEVKVPRLLRVHELAALTGIDAWRWYQMFQRGEGPAHIRIGSTIRVSEAALAAWIAEREAQTKRQGDS